jgi:hypothetical protein
MYKFLFLFSVLIAYSSNAQIEKLPRKLKVTTCTISRKYYPENYKDSVEYQKKCRTTQVTVFNYDKKGRAISKYFESNHYTKLNGKDTFLLTTEIATYNRKGKVLTEDFKSQNIMYLNQTDSIYDYLTYHNYKYDFFNRLKEENFGNNISNFSNSKNRISQYLYQCL